MFDSTYIVNWAYLKATGYKYPDVIAKILLLFFKLLAELILNF